MFDKTWDAFDKCMATFNKCMATFNEECRNLKRKSKDTKIKIGKGSIVNINGASAQLLNDVTVMTKNPDILMKANKKS
jgi:hypothetical protein